MIRSLEALTRAFEDHAPTVHGTAERTQASVALVVGERDDDLALLFIERARHEGDRWSGDIAFPGGRIDERDRDPAATAARETREEVGISLAGRRPLARLDDLVGFRESVVVSGYVFAVEGCPQPRSNHEVRSAFWLNFREIESPARHVTRHFDYRGRELLLPALRVHDEGAHAANLADEAARPALWGLSYRFLELLMEKCGRPIPGMPWNPDV